MGDLLAKGADFVQRVRNAHMTRLVVYGRGGESVEIAATVGRTVFRLEGSHGQVTRYISRDYLVAAADLVLDDERITPQRGDVIRETADDVTYVHEVMSPSSSEPDWRYSDPQRRTLRIHTKQIRQEAT